VQSIVDDKQQQQQQPDDDDNVATYKEDMLNEDQILLPGWFTVEYIRGRRIKNGRVEYLVNNKKRRITEYDYLG
jgi:hypothetical protein